MFKENEQLTIARQEYPDNYAGIGGVGVTVSGKLLVTEDFSQLNISPATRVIENPRVANALTAPVKVYYDPTLVCGLKCSWCLAGVPTRRNSKTHVPSLSGNDSGRICNQIIEAGVLQVKIGGGEPFIYHPFWSAIEQLGDAGIGLSTSTSGVTLPDRNLLTDSQIGLLAKYKVKVSLSVDGSPEFHDKARGKDGLLQAALAIGIPRLKDAGVADNKIEYRATINSDPASLSQVDYLADLAGQTGTLIRIRLARPYGSAADNHNGVVKLTPEVRDLMKKLRDLSKDNPLINIDPFLGFDKPSGIKTGLDCGGGTRQANIDAKGRFFPCGALEPFMEKAHDLLGGEITLLESWQFGDAFLNIRGFYRRENNQSPCSDCVYVDSCQGGCPSVRLSLGLQANPLCPLEL